MLIVFHFNSCSNAVDFRVTFNRTTAGLVYNNNCHGIYSPLTLCLSSVNILEHRAKLSRVIKMVIYIQIIYHCSTLNCIEKVSDKKRLQN